MQKQKEETHSQRKKRQFDQSPNKRQQREHRRVKNSEERKTFWKPVVDEMEKVKLKGESKRRMSEVEKWDKNLQALLHRASHYFLHVPVQYGNLSHELRKAKYLDSVFIREHGIEKTEYKLLQIVPPSKGTGRRFIWKCVKVVADDRKGDLYEFEFLNYTPHDWNTLKYIEAQAPKVSA